VNTDGTALTDISGYRVLYGTSSTNLSSSLTVTDAGVTSSVITGFAPGTYYFAVTTLNSTGVESVVSNPVFKTVP
jgi:hypothetical protein